MDPLAVLKMLWRYKIVTLPVLLITLVAGVFVFQFAPRSYQSSMTIAMINPDIPTEADKIKTPALRDLNPNNPYLRSSDPSLIVQVVIARLEDSMTAEKLKAGGYGNDFTVTRGAGGGAGGFLVDITATGTSPAQSLATTRALGDLLTQELRSLQKVDGADDTYLFSSLVVAAPDKATEQFSSRLRSLIVVFVAGAVLLFGAVSIVRGSSLARHGRRNTASLGGRQRRRRSNLSNHQPAPVDGWGAISGQGRSGAENAPTDEHVDGDLRPREVANAGDRA